MGRGQYTLKMDFKLYDVKISLDKMEPHHGAVQCRIDVLKITNTPLRQ
jgi:hypothetical protein